MLTQINTQTPIRFKANDYQVNYNNRYTPPMPEDSPMDDVFMMQVMEQQKAAKKEKSKENYGNLYTNFFKDVIIELLLKEENRCQVM